MKLLASQLGLSPSDLEGQGVTDEETLEATRLAAAALSQRILERLSEADLSGAVTNAIVAHPSGILKGQDLGFTGRAEKVDTAMLRLLLNSGITPIISPIGSDGAGHSYRLESNLLAVEIAKAMGASKLIYLGVSNGVPTAGQLSAQFSIEEAEQYLSESQDDDAPDPYLRAKMEHMLIACRSGVHRAHLIDARQDEALISELFSNEGIGTMVYANEYEAIRQAEPADLGAIHRLLKHSVLVEEVLTRSESEVEAMLPDTFLFEIDGNVVGCVALITDEVQGDVAELACLVVAEAHANQGIGMKMTEFILNQAKKREVKKVIALSTRAFNYFSQKWDFEEGVVDDLPEPRKQKYIESGRNSKILIKTLS